MTFSSSCFFFSMIPLSLCWYNSLNFCLLETIFPILSTPEEDVYEALQWFWSILVNLSKGGEKLGTSETCLLWRRIELLCQSCSVLEEAGAVLLKWSNFSWIRRLSDLFFSNFPLSQLEVWFIGFIFSGMSFFFSSFSGGQLRMEFLYFFLRVSTSSLYVLTLIFFKPYSCFLAFTFKSFQ